MIVDKEKNTFEENSEVAKVSLSFQTTSNQMEQSSNSQNKQGSVDVNAENKVMNYIFKTLSVFGVVGILMMAHKYQTYWNEWKQFAPKDYVYPSIGDFRIAFYAFIIIVPLRIIIEHLSGPLMYLILHEKYKERTTGDKENEETYLKQMKTCFFKLLWYISVVCLGLQVIGELEWFPKELFGNGDLRTYYSKGYPYIVFINKPTLFDLYYLASLGFTFSDFFFLIFVHKKRSDYDLMVLHHIVTIGLVVISFLTNNSNIGIIVFFLHDCSDIWVYFTRVFINTCLPDFIKYVECALFLFIFIYFRLYCLSDAIYCAIFYIKNHSLTTILLIALLCVLLFMHVFWTYSIIKRFFYKKIEDVGKVKSQKKK